MKPAAGSREEIFGASFVHLAIIRTGGAFV